MARAIWVCILQGTMPMAKTPRILIAGQTRERAQAIQEKVSAAGHASEAIVVSGPQHIGATMIRGRDCVIVTGVFAEREHAAFVRAVARLDAAVPCIAWLDTEDVSWQQKALAAGMRDCITPAQLWRLPWALEREMADCRKKKRFTRQAKARKSNQYGIEQEMKRQVTERTSVHDALTRKIRQCNALEKTLRASRERYRRVVDHQSELIARFGVDARLTFVNDAWCELLGKTRQELLGAPFLMFTPREYRERVLATLESGDDRHLEFPLQIAQRTPWFRWAFTAERSQTGELIEYQVVGRDISALKRARDDRANTSRMLRAVLDGSQSLVACLDVEFNYLLVNEAYACKMHISRSRIVGKNHFELHPDPENMALFKHVIDSGAPFFAYGRPFSREKTDTRNITYWDWSLMPLTDSNNRVTGIIMTLTDVTARVQAQQRLRDAHDELEKRVAIRSAELSRSNELLKKEIAERVRAQQALLQRHRALESIYSILTSCGGSLDTIFEQTAVHLAQMLSAPLAGLGLLENGSFHFKRFVREGKAAHGGVLGGDTAAARAIMRGRRAYKKTGDSIQSLGCGDLSPFLTMRSLLAVPVKNDDNELVGAIICADRGNRAFSASEVQLVEIFARFASHEVDRSRMTRQLQEAQEFKILGQLTSGVAHEVRNPLNAILALTEVMSSELRDDPELQTYMGHVRGNVERLSMLMRDLLNLSNPVRANHIELYPIVNLVKESWESWRAASPFGERRVILDYPPNAERWMVEVDCEKISQVLGNTLENACQHSPETAEIQISLLPSEQGYLRVRIIDRGSGISDKDLPHLFAPFYTTRTGGAGLGLAMCRRIVQAHHGTMSLRNNPNGAGSTAEIRLPAHMSPARQKSAKKAAFAA
jgi:PAS domain S-box-containing protein